MWLFHLFQNPIIVSSFIPTLKMIPQWFHFPLTEKTSWKNDYLILIRDLSPPTKRIDSWIALKNFSTENQKKYLKLKKVIRKHWMRFDQDTKRKKRKIRGYLKTWNKCLKKIPLTEWSKDGKILLCDSKSKIFQSIKRKPKKLSFLKVYKNSWSKKF